VSLQFFSLAFNKPSLLTSNLLTCMTPQANTDTKYYWNTTDHIYRFIPGRLALMKAPHTVDERSDRSLSPRISETSETDSSSVTRIHIDAHIETIKFYYKLAQNSQTWSAP
jgi:Gly-Xaa carboxypeptidase